MNEAQEQPSNIPNAQSVNATTPVPPPAASPSINASTATHEGVFVAQLGGNMVSLSAGALPGETLNALLGRILREARRRSLEVVQGNVFCDSRLSTTLEEPLNFPIAFLARHDTPEGDIRGARIIALPQNTFERLNDAAGLPLGVRWETQNAHYLLLGAMTPADLTATPADQSGALWRDLNVALQASGFTITDVFRTWFYNDKILDWYDDFNRVRTAFFNEHNIFGTIVPASTGIGTTNARAAALSFDALAIKPKHDSVVRIAAIPSPLQCPANDYSSAFSRAVEVAGDGGTHLYVSGTASIEPSGLTAHKDDLDEQIKLSLRVVEAILVSRNMSWSDVVRAVLYFPKIEWMSRFEPCRAALNMPPLPVIYAHSDICRGDLLFEIELDAFKA
jgi:enamine deaminase RidA (YjgF/YER057c/UK114 family)